MMPTSGPTLTWPECCGATLGAIARSDSRWERFSVDRAWRQNDRTHGIVYPLFGSDVIAHRGLDPPMSYRTRHHTRSTP